MGFGPDRRELGRAPLELRSETTRGTTIRVAPHPAGSFILAGSFPLSFALELSVSNKYCRTEVVMDDRLLTKETHGSKRAPVQKT